MKVPGWKRYYATHPQTVHASTTHVLNVKVEKKFIPRKALNVMTTYKQWNALEVPNQSKSNTNYDKTYKMIAIVVKEVRVGEVLDKLQESFGKVKEHQNVKRIQASEFQKDLLDETVKVLQNDYICHGLPM